MSKLQKAQLSKILLSIMLAGTTASVMNGFIPTVANASARPQCHGLNATIWVNLDNNHIKTNTGGTNTTTAFQVQNATSQNILTIDTLNNLTVIGGNVATAGGGGLNTWGSTTSLNTARRTHTSVSSNGYVYVIGGTDGGGATTASTEYAKINADGSLGTWTPTTSMGTARYEHASVVANGYVYTLGGVTGGGVTTTTERAKINADGSLGTWTPTTSMGTLRGYLSAVYANGYIYAIGGTTNGTNTVNTTERAKVNSDGTLGAWVATSNMVAARYGHTSVSANGYIYSLGGWTGVPALNTTEYAKINTDGTLGTRTSI